MVVTSSRSSDATAHLVRHVCEGVVGVDQVEHPQQRGEGVAGETLCGLRG